MVFFNHVSLVTGHSVRQDRSGVDDRTVAAMKELLVGALTGGHPALPIDDGLWLINASEHGRALVVTL